MENPADSGPKTPAETPEEPALVPQGHGGALKTGGNPGNKGGGRTPDLIRATLRESFDKRIPMLEAIADDENQKPEVRIKAAETLAKYGLGTTVTPTNTAGDDLPASIAVTLVKPGDS